MVDVSSETAIPAPMLGGEHEFFQAEKTLSRRFQAGSYSSFFAQQTLKKCESSFTDFQQLSLDNPL